MGIVNFSIPKELVLRFVQFSSIDNFIETGTYRGATSFWAAQHFKKVYTIEIDAKLSSETVSNSDNPIKKQDTRLETIAQSLAAYNHNNLRTTTTITTINNYQHRSSVIGQFTASTISQFNKTAAQRLAPSNHDNNDNPSTNHYNPTTRSGQPF